MADLGKAYVQIVPSADGISGSIQNVLGGEADAAGKGAGLKIAGALKKVVATAGIGLAIKKSLGLGAELEQNLGGTEAVFGKYADNLQTKARDAYKNMGLSASDYMATANKMGSLFQGSGVSQVKSLDMTQKAMQRAADVASVMGIDTSMAMESIAGAAKGNFTMMDNLGVAMNATTLEAYALEKGMNFKWQTASNAEKAELAMKMFMDRTSQYAGNFARESQETLSGSIEAMKASWQDLLANLALGENVSASMQNLVVSAVGALSNIIPAVGNVFASLPAAIGTAISTGLPLIGQQAANLITALTNGINTKIPELSAKLPGMVSNALQSITNAAPTVVAKGMELIMNLGQAIVANAPLLASAVANVISQLVGYIGQHLPEIATAGGEMLGELAAGFVQNLPQMAAAALRIGQFIISSLASVAATMVRSGANLVKGIGRGITSGIGSSVKGAMNKVKDAITKPIDTAKTKVKGILDKLKAFFPLRIGNVFSGIKLPHFSVSGSAPFGLGGKGSPPKISVSWYKKAMEEPYLFNNATLFGAGEAGDEMLYGRAQLMKDIAKATGGGTSPVINNYITVDGAEDPEDWATRFVRQMQLEMRMG